MPRDIALPRPILPVRVGDIEALRVESTEANVARICASTVDTPRLDMETPSYKVLKAAVAGLARSYLAYYGPMSLAPKRAEPMKFSMVRELYSIPSSGIVRIGSVPWSDADHNVFIFRRLICVMMVTAFRLGEIVYHSSGEIMYLTFESLTFNPHVGHRGGRYLPALRTTWGVISCRVFDNTRTQLGGFSFFI